MGGFFMPIGPEIDRRSAEGVVGDIVAAGCVVVVKPESAASVPAGARARRLGRDSYCRRSGDDVDDTACASAVLRREAVGEHAIFVRGEGDIGEDGLTAPPVDCVGSVDLNHAWRRPEPLVVKRFWFMKMSP